MSNVKQDFPEGWETKKLSEVIVINKGLTYKSSDYAKNENEGQIFLTLKSIEKGGGFNKKGIKFYKGDYHEKHIVNPGDLIIANTDLTRDGDVVGAPVIVPQLNSKSKYVISMDLSKIDTNKKLDKNFAYYLFSNSSMRTKMRKFSTGSTVLHLNLNSVKKIKIKLPPLPQQKKIAEILSTIDIEITKTDEIIKQTELLKKGLMQKLFTKGIGHTKFKKTKLGLIPEEWEVRKMSEIATVSGGKRMPKGTLLQTKANSHPYIRVSDFDKYNLSHKNIEYVPDSIYPLIKKYIVSKNDLIISVAGTLGLVAKISKNLDGANLTENADKITIKKANNNFIYQLLKSTLFNKYIESIKTTSAQPKIALEKLRKFELAIPYIQEQIKIADILESVDKKIIKNKKAKKEFLKLKQSLMQDLLTGRKLVN